MPVFEDNAPCMTVAAQGRTADSARTQPTDFVGWVLCCW